MDSEKIVAVIAKIRPIAIKYARACGTTPEDLEQDMMVEIIERVEADDEFMNQTEAYIRRAAQLVALTKMGRFSTEKKYTVEAISETAGDEDDEFDFFEAIPDSTRNPEDLVVEVESIAEVTEVLSGMGLNDQVIALRALQDNGTGSIAEELKVTPPAVSQRKAKIGQAILDLMARNGWSPKLPRFFTPHVSGISETPTGEMNQFMVFVRGGAFVEA